MTDEFKYGSFACNPTSTGDIIPSKKGSKYSVSFDTANDISVSFYRFSKAYFFAANIIVHRMLEKQYIDELDSYFFPVFFLYRHSIELLLKSIACTKIKDQIDGDTP